MIRRCLLCFALCCYAITNNTVLANGVAIALLGDTPYFESTAQQIAIAKQISSDHDIGLLLHAGDIKSGASACSDRLLKQRRDWLNRFAMPVIFTPGDNEWTDCHRKSSGAYLPTERLAFLREQFFPIPAHSLGQNPLPLRSQGESQSGKFKEFTENRLLQWQGVTIASIHLPGSRNDGLPWLGLGEAKAQQLSAVQTRLRQQRNEAATVWLEQGFEQAGRQASQALIVLIHANPGIEAHSRNPKSAGHYADFNRELLKQTAEAGFPVLLVHGDLHRFIFDRPADNLYRVQTWGSPFNQWLKLRLSRDPTQPFDITEVPYRVRWKKR